MRALALVAVSAGCFTAIEPQPGALIDRTTPFSLPSQRGTFSLTDTLAQQHVVLVFYRGHW